MKCNVKPVVACHRGTANRKRPTQGAGTLATLPLPNSGCLTIPIAPP